MRKSFKRIAASLAAAALAFAVMATAVPAGVSATEVSKAGKKAAKADFDPDGTYHAYFGLQEKGTWIFRDEWYSKTLGIDGDDLKKANLTYDQGTLFQSGQDGVVPIEGTVVQDAEITGNGTYTVGVSGINGSLAANDSETAISMLYVVTDIPSKAKDNPVTISDWKLKIDGKDISLPSDIFFPTEYIDIGKMIRFDPMNAYQKDKGEYPDSPDIISPPNDSVEITFTVSGFNSDNADAVEGLTALGGGSSDDASADAGTTSGAEASSSSSSPVVPIVIVVVVVAIIVVVVVVKKKQS